MSAATHFVGSPSAWSSRAPVIVLALLGCAIAGYLSLYQWHVIRTVWDPLFGSDSSQAVLGSAISRALPVPDATLGALAYVVEAVVCALGGSDRWRTQPRLMLVYGVVVVGMALTSLLLVLVQVALVRALCTLCLCSAAVSLINAALAREELAAAIAARKSAARRNV